MYDLGGREAQTTLDGFETIIINNIECQNNKVDPAQGIFIGGNDACAPALAEGAPGLFVDCHRRARCSGSRSLESLVASEDQFNMELLL